MTIVFSRHIYQDLLSRTLGLAMYKIVMNHTCVFSQHFFISQIFAHFYARLRLEGHCVNETFIEGGRMQQVAFKKCPVLFNKID